MSASETPTRPRFRLPKSRRLQKRREFLRLQQQGKRLDLGPVFAFVLPTPPDDSPSKFGITTTKRIGHAVFRNRLRRLLRDAVRRLWLPAKQPYDVVFVVKQGLSSSLTQADLDRALTRLLQRLRSASPNKS